MLGDEALHGERAAGGLEALGVVVVLDEDGDAAEWRELVGAGEVAVAGVGLGEGVGIEGDDGVQGEAVDGLLVVGLDAGEVGLNDGAAGSAAFEERGLGLGDGGADGVERLGVGLGMRERRDGEGD